MVDSRWLQPLIGASSPPPDDDFWYEDDLEWNGYSRGVSPDNALRIATVFSCVRVIAETLASLPCVLYRRVAERGKREAFEHPLHYLLKYQPNSWQTAFEFWEMMTAHCLLRGNAYAEIVPGERGAVSEIVPIHPCRVEPYWVGPRRDRRINYLIRSGTSEDRDNREEYVLTQEEMFHLRFMSCDGLVGISPIEAVRRAFDFSEGLQESASSTIENDSSPGGMLTTPQALKKEAKEELRRSWENKHRGPKRKKRVAIADNGLSWVNIGMSNADMQFIEQRRYSKEEICGIFRVPPHKVADLARSTNNNIEHQSIEFVTDCLRPWLVRSEQVIMRDLISQPNVYLAEFDVSQLLRGDSESRAKAAEVMFRNGALTQDEWREQEGRNPYRGELGNRPFIMVNMVPLDRVDDFVDSKKPPEKNNEPLPDDPAGNDGDGVGNSA